MRIKDFLSVQIRLSKYTLEFVIYIVITSKEQIVLHIWPKNLNYDTSTENIIIIS